MSDLSLWVSVLVLGLLFWRWGSSWARPFIAPALGLIGRLYGQLQTQAELQQDVTVLPEPIAPVTASQQEITPNDAVTDRACSDLELVWIAYMLGQSCTPAAIAKLLPKYSPSRYREYLGKVAEVESLIAEKDAIERKRAERRSLTPPVRQVPYKNGAPREN